MKRIADMISVYVHALVLALTIGGSFVISRSHLGQYDLQITALLFIIYFIAKRVWKDKESAVNSAIFSSHRLLESALFAYITTTLVNGTGGLTSPLFFLYYFLIFALSLILEPAVSLTTTTTLVLLYVFLDTSTASFKDFIPLISLPFMTPFALFLGKEYQKVLADKRLIKILASRNRLLSSETAQSEENSFLFLSLIIRNHLKAIKNAVENFMGDHELEVIRKNVRRMEQLIDRFESKE